MKTKKSTKKEYCLICEIRTLMKNRKQISEDTHLKPDVEENITDRNMELDLLGLEVDMDPDVIGFGFNK